MSHPLRHRTEVDEEFNMFLNGIDELMRATYSARKIELEIVVENERTAADVCLTGMLEIKNIDKQIENRAVKVEICVQTKRPTSKWKTVTPKATRARTGARQPHRSGNSDSGRKNRLCEKV